MKGVLFIFALLTALRVPAEQSPAYQTTPSFDVRTFGVIGNGTTDDTAAIQNAVNAACKSGVHGMRIVAWNSQTNKPLSMLVSSTIDFTKCWGVFFDGGSSQGESTENTSGFIWGGPAGGTVMLINQTRDSTFQNFFIETQTSAGHNEANVGLDIDEDGTVTSITTNDVYRNILVRSHDSNAKFVAIRLGKDAPGNVERQIFDHITVNCSDNAAANSNNGIGWQINGASGAEPYWVELHDYDAANCSRGIDVEAANILKIDGGLSAANYTDLYCGGGRGITYSDVRSENGKAQIAIGGNCTDLSTYQLSFSGLTKGTSTYTYLRADGGTSLAISRNTWDNVEVTPIAGPTASNSATFHLHDNTYPVGRCPTVREFNYGGWELGDYQANGVACQDWIVAPVGLSIGGKLGQQSAGIWAGTCNMISGACSAIIFATPYATAVACQVSWTGKGKLTGILSSNRTITGLRPKSSVTTDTAEVDWFCSGNPN